MELGARWVGACIGVRKNKVPPNFGFLDFWIFEVWIVLLGEVWIVLLGGGQIQAEIVDFS